MKVLNRSLDNVAAMKATERIQHPALDDNADNMECNIGFLTVLLPKVRSFVHISCNVLGHDLYHISLGASSTHTAIGAQMTHFFAYMDDLN